MGSGMERGVSAPHHGHRFQRLIVRTVTVCAGSLFIQAARFRSDQNQHTSLQNALLSVLASPFFPSTSAHFSHIPPLNESVERLFNGGGAVCSVKLLRLNGAERRRCVILTAGNFRSASLFCVLKRHRPARTVRPGLFTDSGRSTVAARAAPFTGASPRRFLFCLGAFRSVFSGRVCVSGETFSVFFW